MQGEPLWAEQARRQGRKPRSMRGSKTFCPLSEIVLGWHSRYSSLIKKKKRKQALKKIVSPKSWDTSNSSPFAFLLILYSIATLCLSPCWNFPRQWRSDLPGSEMELAVSECGQGQGWYAKELMTKLLTECSLAFSITQSGNRVEPSCLSSSHWVFYLLNQKTSLSLGSRLCPQSWSAGMPSSTEHAYSVALFTAPVVPCDCKGSPAWSGQFENMFCSSGISTWGVQ